ncbi:MAG: hypothetical protein ACREF7_04305 [Candidatus Saccharimonadales bacterium]
MALSFDTRHMATLAVLSALADKHGYRNKIEANLLDFVYTDTPEVGLGGDVSIWEAFKALEELSWYSDYFEVLKSPSQKAVQSYVAVTEPRNSQQVQMPITPANLQSLKDELTYQFYLWPDVDEFSGLLIKDLSRYDDRYEVKLAYNSETNTLGLRGQKLNLLVITAKQQKFLLDKLYSSPDFSISVHELERQFAKVDKRKIKTPQEDRAFRKTVDNLNKLTEDWSIAVTLRPIKSLIKYSDDKNIYKLNPDYI